MALPRKKLVATAAIAVVGVAGYYLYSAFALQGQGTLAQAPLNIESNVKPAFIMAVDDSGSMTFQTQFPASDGVGCWSDDAESFFESNGSLRTAMDKDEDGACQYYYVLPGAKLGDTYRSIPPLDTLGFARSSDFNPTFFNPKITYMPWAKADGSPYDSTIANPKGNASVTDTKIDPRYTPTIKLAGKQFNTTSYSFYIRSGMKIPAGVQFRYGGTTYKYDHVYEWNSGAREIYIEYVPATFYLKYTSDTDPRPVSAELPGAYDNVPRAHIKDACGTGCDMWRYEIRTDDADALQNFANWFSYYGNRNRAMVAGMTRALVEISNMRVGYFTINSGATSCGWNCTEYTAYSDVAMRNMATATEKASLFTDLTALPASGSTPNRWAVEHLGKQFQRTGTGAPIELACQKNAGMLFTDGYSNQGGPAVGGLDNAMEAPFKDSNDSTMADIVAKYYLNNSKGDSPLVDTFAKGKVPIPKACGKTPDAAKTNGDARMDCQANLHMNFYGITLGGRGNLYDQDAVRDAYTDSSVYNNWPARQNDNRSTVDDIWHAAINTRGEYVSARTPVDIIGAMRRILASVGAGETPSGSIGLTGSRVGEGSFTVVPRYTSANNSTDWYSTLTAESVKSSYTDGVTYTHLWEASSKLSGGARDTIWAGKTGTSVNPAVDKFSAASVSLDDLCSDSFATCTTTGPKSIADKLKINLTQAVAYLKGDESLEVSGTSGSLRERTTLLGDIVNSSPVTSTPQNDDFGYRALPGTTAGTYDTLDYKAYLKKKKDQTRDPMVYVGANDGMLHAFNGKTGVEEFAYIPSTALGHMGNLLFPYNELDKNDQVFKHRYYVDGPINVSDAYVDKDWETVLVGTAGAGGRGVFALNVSDPDNFDATSVLWEINDKVATLDTGGTAIKNNIGHVLSKPVIVPVKNSSGKVSWKAIFGNGYGSESGDAILFVVNLEDGEVSTIKAEETSGPAKNGLGSIIAIDRYTETSKTALRDGYVDTVYAADQNGAVWKFNLLSNDAQTIPLFAAADADGLRQPILGGLEAASGPGGGVMVYFGTGSFSFEGDPADKQLQSLYGILDPIPGDVTTTILRTSLQQQKVTSDTNGDRIMTTNGLALGMKGWYVDLGVVSGSTTTATGERSVGNPVIANGVVFFPTFDPDTTDSCATGGTNRLYGLNALSGAAALTQVHVGSPTGPSPGAGTGAVKLNTQGSAPVKDVAVMTTPRVGPLAKEATTKEQEAALAAKCSLVVQAAGAPPMYLPRPCGRQSWRQVR